MVEILDTPLVYPYYNVQEGMSVEPATENIQGRLIFHLLIHTYVRKQYNDEWYLIPVIMRSDNILIPDSRQEYQKAQHRKDIEMQFHNQCYKTLLFYRIDERLFSITNMDGRPLLFKDASQVSEEKRLGINTNQ